MVLSKRHILFVPEDQRSASGTGRTARYCFGHCGVGCFEPTDTQWAWPRLCTSCLTASMRR